MAETTGRFVLPRAEQMDTTALKKSMGQLGTRLQTSIIEVTKHGRREAVIVDPDCFDRLAALAGVDHQAMGNIQNEFDKMIVDMQKQVHDAAVDSLMSVSGADLSAFLEQHYNENPPRRMAPARSESNSAVGKPFKARRRWPGLGIVTQATVAGEGAVCPSTDAVPRKPSGSAKRIQLRVERDSGPKTRPERSDGKSK